MVVLWICLIIISPYIFLMLPTKIIGKRYTKKLKKEAYILGCNHQTFNDAIILKARINRKMKIMSKDSLFKNKFIGGFLKQLGAFPVKRGGNDIQAIKQTLGYLKAGKQLLMFPEGTRIKSEDLGEMKNGLVMIALKTDCYVIPSIFRKVTKPFVFNKLLIGKPFKFSEYEEFKDVKITKEILSKATAILTEKMQYLKEVDIKEYKKIVKNDNKKG